MSSEVIVYGFPNTLVGIECEDEEAKIFVSIYEQITYCYDKQKYLFQAAPSVKAAKECVKIYEYVNSKLKFPVEFIQKGKYVIIIRKGAVTYDFIKELPNTSHAVELFIAASSGGDELCNSILKTRKAGYEPKIKMNYKTGKIEVQVIKEN